MALRTKRIQQLVVPGYAEAYAQGFHEGCLEAWQKSILVVVEVRLGRPPKTLMAAIEATSDLHRLEAAVRTAAVASSFGEVEKVLASRRRRASR